MSFIEITVKDHTILHGFDENNQEILEEVKVEKPQKKLVSINRIQSVSEKFILISYAYDRLIYWEYLDGYQAIKQKLMTE